MIFYISFIVSARISSSSEDLTKKLRWFDCMQKDHQIYAIRFMIHFFMNYMLIRLLFQNDLHSSLAIIALG